LLCDSENGRDALSDEEEALLEQEESEVSDIEPLTDVQPTTKMESNDETA